MNDTLRFFANEPVHRKHHHGELTFRMVYAFDENFVLPLSHDEVVHGKGSLFDRMPGDTWQKLAGLRLLYGYQWGLPGKKLLFMGNELAMPGEWNHEQELPWALLADPGHAGVCHWVGRLNELLRAEPALHVDDSTPAGFSWVIGDDAANGVVAFFRHAPDSRTVLVVLSLTPVPRPDYRIGVPVGGEWEVLGSSDAAEFGGSGIVVGDGETGAVWCAAEPSHGYDQSMSITIPPLSAIFLAPTPNVEDGAR
jgi:1,4-alpha-glucan branching enzyme